ncbi:hypothetical protein [uncultured Desulfobacter sp.]|uniref:hypothetical protein n=1 Tax=uncultured Desulfobacter sp. TaxID=240139 RepID=UPI002AAB147D|nr:hypothetical protein [uncultured Desulfobacter sp.]
MKFTSSALLSEESKRSLLGVQRQSHFTDSIAVGNKTFVTVAETMDYIKENQR